MPSKRPPAIQKKAYVEIDLELLESTGEIRLLGAPIIAPEITEKIPRGKFEIVYTSELFRVLDKLGNKKIQVLAYLLDEKDGQNTVNTTIRKISKDTGVSVPTVQSTINILRDCGLLTRSGTLYMLTPGLMVKGNQLREAYLMRRFEEMREDEQDLIDAVPADVNPQLEFDADGNVYQRAK